MAARFHVGQMRQRVTIQTVTQVAGEDGQPVEAWGDLASAFASVMPAGGFETQTTGSVGGTGQYTVIMRYRDDVFEHGPRCRLRWVHSSRVRILGVRSVQFVDGQRRFMQLACTEDADVANDS